MRGIIVGALAGVVLAGCGSGFGKPSDRDVLISSCIAGGEAEAACGCIADAMKTNLSPALFKKTAEAVGRNGENVMTFIGGLAPAEAMEFAAVTNDMMACSLAATP